MPCASPLRRLLTGLLVGAACANAGVVAQQGGAAGGNAIPVARGAGSWNWGNWEYDKEFTAKFQFQNDCDRPVVLNFDTREVPFLAIMPRVDAKPGLNEVDTTLKTPPWPTVPQCTDLTGDLIVTSSGYETEKGVCEAQEQTWTVTAHVHWWDRPGPPEKLKVAKPDDCTVWWNTGHKPPNNPGITEAQCLDTIRALALAYRERVLGAVAQRAPAEWAWLPSAAAIQSMSVDELFAMKRRAAEQLGFPSSQE